MAKLWVVTIHDVDATESSLRTPAYNSLRRAWLNPPSSVLSLQTVGARFTSQTKFIAYFAEFAKSDWYVRFKEGQIDSKGVLQYLRDPPEPPPPLFGTREDVLAMMPPEWRSYPELETIVHRAAALSALYHLRAGSVTPEASTGTPRLPFNTPKPTIGMDGAAHGTTEDGDEIEFERVKGSNGRVQWKVKRKKTTNLEDLVLEELILQAEYAKLLRFALSWGQGDESPLPTLGLARPFKPSKN